eukprot:9205230-Pyramimonas_sp.AAC.1
MHAWTYSLRKGNDGGDHVAVRNCFEKGVQHGKRIFTSECEVSCWMCAMKNTTCATSWQIPELFCGSKGDGGNSLQRGARAAEHIHMVCTVGGRSILIT